ncbi:hypothetical protein DFQ30_006121 [Apophysomyces sp. BC1015]|nr:hypothetical protein DFQ30_006121 [Apophysomyces sp. BC1015]KAG0176462.1 hypothetical protein DFQ29_006089 [Apophysomyces sp. BC1021]
MSIMFVTRLGSITFWIHFLDSRPTLHGVLTALLTAIGSASVILMLSIPPITLSWLLMLCATISQSLFYQPIVAMIDSAILKMLGDDKILYGAQRWWGKATAACMAVVLGICLRNDHDFDTLLVTSLIGSVILFLLSMSTTVEPIVEQKPSDLSLLKNAPSFEDTRTYKPYCLFGEHLSHISEEEEVSSIFPQIHTKRCSRVQSSLSTDPYEDVMQRMPSLELALLPLPPLEASMAAAVMIWPMAMGEEGGGGREYEYNQRHAYLLLLQMFLLGMVGSMMNSLCFIFLCDGLHMSVPLVGVVGAVSVLASMIADKIVYKVKNTLGSRSFEKKMNTIYLGYPSD